MAQDTEQLVLTISADVRQMQRALDRMVGLSSTSTKKIQNHFDRMGRDLDRSLARSFGGIGRTIRGGLAAFGVGLSLRGVQQFVDAATRIQNSLKVAGLEGEELTRVYDKLFQSAQKNSAPLETLVQLYGRIAIVQKELGVSTEEALGFTDKIALALRVAGTDAQSASGALLQLAQALGSGTVRAEEFNSILEGALPVAQAAAAGLKEAGGSVATLRQLVVDGKVSSEAFFRAFEAGAVTLEQKVAGAQKTVSQSIVTLFNALTDVAGEFDKATGASSKFSGAIENAARVIGDFDTAGFIKEIEDAYGAVDKFLNRLGNASVFKSLNDLLGVETGTPGNPINLETVEAENKIASLEREVRDIQERIALNNELNIDNSGALANLAEVQAALNALRASAGSAAVTPTYVPGTPGDPNALASRPANAPPPVQTVSLSDFAPPPARGGGGSKGGGRSKESDYARETEQLRERTEAINAETAALAGLNPLVNDYGFAVAKARAELELINAAQEDGRAITPQLRAEISGLAESYASAEVAAEKLAETQDRIREASEFFAETFGDAIMDLIPAIETGNAALDKLLNTLIEAVAQAALLGKGPLGGGGGGLIGSLLGAFGFRASGGPVKKGQPYIVGERRPEVFVPDQNGTILPSVPNAPSLPSMAGIHNNQKPLSLSLVSRFDADGGFETAVERASTPVARRTAAASTARLARAVPGMVDRRNDERQYRRLRPSLGG